VGLNALAGLRRGLIGTVLALGGLVGGAILGDRLAPHVLSNGAHSPYMPLAAFLGAILGALVLRAVASFVASFLRNGLRLIPPLHALDSLGGLLGGALFGLVIVWVLGAVALELPGEPSLRQKVQRSEILSRLNAIAPPGRLLRALDRIDELPTLNALLPAATPLDPGVVTDPAVRAAEPSVVRVTDEACGLGIEGSGWVADPHLVVTAAHVVAGANGIRVDGKPARLFAIDRKDDVAVLDVPALSARPLPFDDPRDGAAVAILGYPEDGPLNAQPGRIGETITARFNGGSPRPVTEFSGLVRHGNSGGPALDASGVVETTVFASAVGARAGFGVPTQAVSAALARAHAPVSSGSC
jgi:S1-C subfamily serine protease